MISFYTFFLFLGQPIYTRGGYLRKPLIELLEPNWLTPKSRITLDDPWWWEYPELRPFVSPYTTLPRRPFYLRDSFLSPIKRTYLWGYHPVRPFYSKSRWLYPVIVLVFAFSSKVLFLHRFFVQNISLQGVCFAFNFPLVVEKK